MFMTDDDRLSIIRNDPFNINEIVIRYSKDYIDFEEFCDTIDIALERNAYHIMNCDYVEIFRVNQNTGELISTIGAFRK